MPEAGKKKKFDFFEKFYFFLLTKYRNSNIIALAVEQHTNN